MKHFSFNIEDYYIQTKKYYYFFDGLFKLEEGIKKDILDSLNIPDSTYRTNRSKNYVKNNNHFILLNYFHYDTLMYPREVYETCFAKIMYAFYYKESSSIPKLQKDIEEFILQNNYLKPIFTIFQIILDIGTIGDYHVLLEIVGPKLDYLNLFPEDYYDPKIGYIVSMIQFYFNRKVDEIKLKNDSLKYVELSWLYSFFKGNKAYLNQNDYEAIVYYEMCLKDYKESFNISRIVSTINTLAFLHNAHEQYELSIEKSSIILQHTFYQEAEPKWQNFLSTHYLFSLYMLGRYEEIQQFFNIIVITPDVLHMNSILIGILAARKLNCSFKDFNPIFDEIIEKDETIQLFILMLDKKISTSKMKELKVYSTYYFKKIAESLKLDT